MFLFFLLRLLFYFILYFLCWFAPFPCLYPLCFLSFLIPSSYHLLFGFFIILVHFTFKLISSAFLFALFYYYLLSKLIFTLTYIYSYFSIWFILYIFLLHYYLFPFLFLSHFDSEPQRTLELVIATFFWRPRRGPTFVPVDGPSHLSVIGLSYHFLASPFVHLLRLPSARPASLTPWASTPDRLTSFLLPVIRFVFLFSFRSLFPSFCCYFFVTASLCLYSSLYSCSFPSSFVAFSMFPSVSFPFFQFLFLFFRLSFLFSSAFSLI